MVRWKLAAAALAALAALVFVAPACHRPTAAKETRQGEAATTRKPDVIFVPTPEPVVEEMMSLAKVGPGDVVYDLGCGDGRIAIAAAKRGAAKSVCVDIDPERIREARANVKEEGVEEKVTVVQADLFQMDFSDATVVTLYLLPDLNLKLRPKILALRPGTRIVSHAFDMGDWKPEVEEVVDGKTVYYWTVPEPQRRVQARTPPANQ
jgi:SAM-dependent methyltransferase